MTDKKLTFVIVALPALAVIPFLFSLVHYVPYIGNDIKIEIIYFFNSWVIPFTIFILLSSIIVTTAKIIRRFWLIKFGDETANPEDRERLLNVMPSFLMFVVVLMWWLNMNIFEIGANLFVIILFVFTVIAIVTVPIPSIYRLLRSVIMLSKDHDQQTRSIYLRRIFWSEVNLLFISIIILYVATAM